MKKPLLLLCVSLSLVQSCSRQQEGQTELITFPLRGEIVAIDTTKSTLTVAHEAIPNYMSAMTMPFKVKDRSMLRHLGLSDTIAATLAVSRTESWLEGITVAGKGTPERALSADDIITARVVTTGELFPDETLLNQDSTVVKISSFRGKALALTFIYTRCPLPDFCIRMSNHFATIQRTLRRDGGVAGMWHLISVSFDPAIDRPAVLKRYAAVYGADHSTWDFATDPDTSGTAIRRLADGLGLMYSDDEGLIAHNLRTVLIDKQGKLVRVMNGNEWTPDDVAADIRALAQQ